MKSTFDDRHLKSVSAQEYTSYPLRREIEDLFSRYGYNNYELAYLCSFASKKDIDAFFPRYERLYNLTMTAAKLKCPMLFKKDTPTYIDDESRNMLIVCLSDRIKKDFGKYSSQNYELFRKYVFERAREVGWNPFELIHLVETELKEVNGSDVYSLFDAVHTDDIKSAAERTIQHVLGTYDIIEPPKRRDMEVLVNKDGQVVGYVLTPMPPAGMVNDHHVGFPFYGSLEVIDELLYRECSSVLSGPDYMPFELRDNVIPRLNYAFTQHVTSNPLRSMVSQYGCIFDIENDDKARAYYKQLYTYYESLSFLDYGKPSPYVAAQYLYSMLTGIPVCEKLPIKVGGLICEFLNLFGYISITDIDVIPDKEKFDAVKRFLKLDKLTGLYKRLA